jgi:hypothetical protein
MKKSGRYASRGITAGSFVAELGLPSRTERCDVSRRNDYRQKASCLNIDNYFFKTLAASGVGLLCGLTKALSFLPALGLLRIGNGGLSSAFNGLKQLGADFSLS